MKHNNKNESDKSSGKKKDFPGYPRYPENEDIYNRDKEDEDVDPEDVSNKKSLNVKGNMLNEKTFKQDKTGSDLDIPRVELDDSQENIGNEDEENNYYSLGDNN